MVLLAARVPVCRYYNRGKIMTVISRTHQVPIKICPLFWKMIIIGCTTIIIVVVDRGNLEAFFFFFFFFESNSREITLNWPISGGGQGDQLFFRYSPNIAQKSLNPDIRAAAWHTVATRAVMSAPAFFDNTSSFFFFSPSATC